MLHSPKNRIHWGSLAVVAVFAVLLSSRFPLLEQRNPRAMVSPQSVVQTGANVIPPVAAQPAPSEIAAPTHIGKDAAVDAALRHAGLGSNDVFRVECELDREIRQTVYEIDFKSGGKEYEYEVDAFTGSVLRAKSEYDD